MANLMSTLLFFYVVVNAFGGIDDVGLQLSTFQVLALLFQMSSNVKSA